MVKMPGGLGGLAEFREDDAGVKIQARILGAERQGLLGMRRRFGPTAGGGQSPRERIVGMNICSLLQLAFGQIDGRGWL